MDHLTKARRAHNMRAIKSKDTAPELAVRRLVYGIGYRYRLHGKRLPGKPDLVFSSRRKVIFVHGCFWHQHGCSRGTTPKTNKPYWEPKLNKNKERDNANYGGLRRLGWQIMVIWECEIREADLLEKKIRKFLS